MLFHVARSKGVDGLVVVAVVAVGIRGADNSGAVLVVDAEKDFLNVRTNSRGDRQIKKAETLRRPCLLHTIDLIRQKEQEVFIAQPLRPPKAYSKRGGRAWKAQ